MKNHKSAHELKIPNLLFEPNEQLIPKMFNSNVSFFFSIFLFHTMN